MDFIGVSYHLSWHSQPAAKATAVIVAIGLTLTSSYAYAKIQSSALVVKHLPSAFCELEVFNPDQNRSLAYCSGTLISNGILQTAAHCQSLMAKLISDQAALGLHARLRYTCKPSSPRSAADWEYFESDQFIKNPAWSSEPSQAGYLKNDLALARVPQHANWSPIQFVKVAREAEALKSSGNCVQAGYFGPKSEVDQEILPVLQVGKVHFLSSEDAIGLTESSGWMSDVIIRLAGFNTLFMDLLPTQTDHGDSGGAVACKDPKTGQFILIGSTYGGLIGLVVTGTFPDGTEEGYLDKVMDAGPSIVDQSEFLTQQKIISTYVFSGGFSKGP